MRKIKVVVLLVQQLQHGFTKNAKVSPNLTVAQIHSKHTFYHDYWMCYKQNNTMTSKTEHNFQYKIFTANFFKCTCKY